MGISEDLKQWRKRAHPVFSLQEAVKEQWYAHQERVLEQPDACSFYGTPSSILHNVKPWLCVQYQLFQNCCLSDVLQPAVDSEAKRFAMLIIIGLLLSGEVWDKRVSLQQKKNISGSS